jgi:hypothetical protein
VRSRGDSAEFAAGNDAFGDTIGFNLGCIICPADPNRVRGGIRTSLLHNVGQLMGQQFAAILGRRRVLTRSKYDIVPNGISARLDGFG